MHRFLSEDSYWCPGVSRDVVDRSIENSLCFGLYEGEEQIGFARVVTDRATFAHLMDVFVVAARRGEGLGKKLIGAVMEHPDLQDLRIFSLATEDAHDLYERFGFKRVPGSERRMEL